MDGCSSRTTTRATAAALQNGTYAAHFRGGIHAINGPACTLKYDANLLLWQIDSHGNVTVDTFVSELGHRFFSKNEIFSDHCMAAKTDYASHEQTQPFSLARCVPQ